MKNESARIKIGLSKLMGASVRNAELLFGIQALSTGMLSFIMYAIEHRQINSLTLVFMILASLSSMPQIYAVLSDRLVLRHWTNFSTFTFSAMHSLTLFLGKGEVIAIFGYAGLSLASLYCFWFTARVLKYSKNEDIAK